MELAIIILVTYYLAKRGLGKVLGTAVHEAKDLTSEIGKELNDVFSSKK
tara:strand:+ start:383 stop:529 length:147 start_codon:yes stop_codon:yes gene_type:complete